MRVCQHKRWDSDSYLSDVLYFSSLKHKRINEKCYNRMNPVKRIIQVGQINLKQTVLVLGKKNMGCQGTRSPHTRKHTHTSHTHASQTIKPLVPLHTAAPVSVGHQFLLVLRHQAFKTISVPVSGRLLCHCSLKNPTKTTIKRGWVHGIKMPLFPVRNDSE